MDFGVCDRVAITVVDYEKSLCSSELTQITLSHYDSLYDMSGAEFDIVIASAVLEHLPNLGKDWKALVSLLAAGGAMYVRTPYKYPLFQFLRRFGIELEVEFPEHIWDLGKEFYCNLAGGNLTLAVSKPSLVENSFRKNFLQCLAAYVLKLPWYICHAWPFVGGWEAVFIKK